MKGAEDPCDVDLCHEGGILWRSGSGSALGLQTADPSSNPGRNTE